MDLLETELRKSQEKAFKLESMLKSHISVPLMPPQQPAAKKPRLQVSVSGPISLEGLIKLKSELDAQRAALKAAKKQEKKEAAALRRAERKLVRQEQAAALASLRRRGRGGRGRYRARGQRGNEAERGAELEEDSDDDQVIKVSSLPYCSLMRRTLHRLMMRT
jgi:hypothetical protein